VVKKFVTNPSKIARRATIKRIILVKSTKGTTTRVLIRAANRAVPLNPQAPLNNPRSGNFATKRRVPSFG